MLEIYQDSISDGSDGEYKRFAPLLTVLYVLISMQSLHSLGKLTLVQNTEYVFVKSLSTCP